MDVEKIVEHLKYMHESDLETLFKAISKANLPSEYILGEAKVLKDFKEIITKHS